MAGNSMWCLRNVFKTAGKKGSRESNGSGGKGGKGSPVHSGGNKSPSSSGSSGDSGRGAGDRGSKVLDPEEMEEQQRVNKLIEKQIKKDKRRFRSTHRLQVVGLEGSGKSTLIHQLRLLDAAARGEVHFTQERRRERRAQIRALVRDSAQALAQGMRADGMTPQENVSETTASLEWLSGHATRDCPEPCQALYEHAKRIWADPSTQAFFKRHRHNQELASAAFFLDRISLVSKPEYLPTDADILRHYQPTTSLQETSIEIEHVTFSLFEVNANTNNRLVQRASDAIALIFVADVSAFDAVIDRDQGLTRLHEALLMFRSVWNTDCPGGTVGPGGGASGGGPGGRHGISRSVILFLNKIDLFEEKIRKGGYAKLRRYFPQLDDYRLVCPAAKKELNASGADKEVVKAKYFVRDSFLQVAAQGAAAAAAAEALSPCGSSAHSFANSGLTSGSSGGGGGPAGPHCYPHFTCAIHTEDVGKLINDCCRDILQRVHLRMHEIL